MPQFEVLVNETLQKKYTVEAETAEAAEAKVEDDAGLVPDEIVGEEWEIIETAEITDAPQDA